MQTICCSVCYAHCSWLEALDKIAEGGWTGVELVAMPGWIHVDVAEKKAATLAKELESRGLKLRAIHAGVLSGSGGTLTTYQISYLHSCIDTLAELGADQLVFTGGVREDEKLADLAVAVERLADHLDQAGVKLGLENHPNNRVEYIEDFDYLMQRIDHPQIGITADLGLFHRSGVDVTAVFEKHGDRVHHVHVKDYRGHESVALGRGDVDLLGLLRVLKDRGYNRNLSVELEAEDPTCVDEQMATSFKYMSELVKML